MTRYFPSILLATTAFVFFTAAPLHVRAQDETLPAPAQTWLENRAYTQEDIYDIPPPDSDQPQNGYPTQKQTKVNKNDRHAPILPDYQQPQWGKEENDVARPSPSAIEDMYSARAGETLEQFGYDIFSHSQQESPASTPPMGAVQDDFILGTGDEVQITFTGQRTDQRNYRINSEGLLIIPDMPPLSAAGRTIGDIRAEIDSALSSLHNTRAYISLTAVRQIGILVMGHVNMPGRQNLTVFHTALDALNAAGGIKKTGTMRTVRLIRQGRTEIIDIYDLLQQGESAADTQLRDGDRIIVPPIGPTIAASGDVKHPGIFEIRAKKEDRAENLNLEEVLSLSGGILTAGQNRLIHLALDDQGRENATEIKKQQERIFSDGSMLMVRKTQESRAGMVELLGHTRRPGLHDLNRNRTLSLLLDSPDTLGTNIYPLIGIVERWDSSTLSQSYLNFSVRSVSERKTDMNLQEKDRVILLGKTEIKELYQYDKKKTDQLEKASYSQDRTSKLSAHNALQDSIRIYLKNRSVTLAGAVMHPGQYPISEDITLDQLFAVAGGLTRNADASNLEITAASRTHGSSNIPLRSMYDLNTTPPENIILRPGDSIRVASNERIAEQRTVTLSGEVLHPGPYDILPGDRISDLLKRAGNLTPQAYPEGAIFSRESQRKAEKVRFRASAQDMKRALAGAIEREKNPPDARQIEMVRELARELEEVTPLGRITIESDPDILSLKPELDMLLEPGDRLYIPRRPLTVRVDGEVLSPASLQFRQDKNPADYIKEAGGFTYHADKGRAFVIFPDGSAQPLKSSLWKHNDDLIPPGSTIIVPRDPKPFDFIESAKDVSQILSNLAITSIFIDDIRD